MNAHKKAPKAKSKASTAPTPPRTSANPRPPQARTLEALAEPQRPASHEPPFEQTEQSFKLGSKGEKIDDLGEELGEAFVQSATSGAQAAEEFRDEETIDEKGGPFVETDGATEFAKGTDPSNPEDADREPFPKV
jgi:hypothetical protein